MGISEKLRAFLPVDIQDAEGNLTRKVSGAPITAAAIAEIAEEAEQLEQLCRDMYDCYTSGQYKECYECEYFDQRESHCGFTDRMDAFGLLEGGDNA